MATRLEDEFDPTRINAPDAAYPAGSLKDETTPGVSDDGTPLASRVGNDWQGFSQSALDKAGIAANGQPDSVSNPQILQAIEQMYNDGDSQLSGGNIWPLSSQDSLPLGAQSSSVPAGVTRLRVNTGSEVELLYLWESSGDFGTSTQTITNITANSTGGYDIVTNIQSYEFLISVNLNYRNSGDLRGWGALLIGDNSVQLQAALDSGLNIEINDLVFDISTGASSSNDNQKISGTGGLRATSSDLILLSLDGEDQSVSSLTFDGNSLAARGVDASGANISVIGNKFFDFFSTTIGCAPVRIDSALAGEVKKNKFFNTSSVTTGSIGDQAGSARAILLRFDGDRQEWFDIKDNYIDTVTGREGDAIQVQCIDGPLPYKSGKARIINNFIKDPNRRAVKIQASDTEVKLNRHENNFTIVQAPNFRASVETVGGSGHIINENVLDGSIGITVNVSGSGVQVDDISIKDNRLITGYNDFGDPGWPSSTQRTVLASEVDNIMVSNNYSIGGKGSILFFEDCNKGTVIGNRLETELPAGAAIGTGVNLSDCDGFDVSGNYGRSDTSAKIYFVNVDGGSNHTITNNHARYDPSLSYAAVRFVNATDRMLVQANSSYSDSFMTVTGTPTNSRKVNNVNVGSGGDGNDP